jgi:ATP-dependent DNA ligase
LIERKTRLKKIIAETNIQISESFEVDGREMYEHACSIGLEGAVSKVRDSRYVSGRSKDWLKRPVPSARRCLLPGSRSTAKSSTASISAGARAGT